MINLFKRIFKRFFSFPKYIKSKHQFDILFYDDLFPHPRSGFKIEEYKVLLQKFENCKIVALPTAYKFLKTDVELHKRHINDFKNSFPFSKNKFITREYFININTKLFYCIFLNTIYNNIIWLDKYKIPFIFTLNAGGGFRVNNTISDYKLERVLKSPQLRKVIVTQPYTRNYLINKKYCKLEKIEYIYGGVVPQNSIKIDLNQKIYYPQKESLDIVFCATKYMPKGLDKGYDIFIDVAKKLVEKYDFLHFHVIGGFDRNEIDVDLLGDSITFYGYQSFTNLTKIYKNMDVILSPNRASILEHGAFDGFPLGTVVEAVFNGVLAIVTDELNQNVTFTNGEELIITKPDVNLFVDEILNIIKNPYLLKKISFKGKNKFIEIFSNDSQMAPRIDLLVNNINTTI